MYRTKCCRLTVLLVVAQVLFLSFMIGSFAAEEGGRSSLSFRVVTYNIHHGEGMDGKVDLERITALIKRERADIVGLQEVDKGTERTARRDFPAELAQLTGMTCIFSNNYAFQGGEYGNAILTRFPVRKTANLHYRMVRPGEQRGLLQVVLDVNGREIVFMNTHLDFRPDDSERLSNVVEIFDTAKMYPQMTVILCGDFNDVPSSRTYQRLGETWADCWARVGKGDGFTIPVREPSKRIDYIWMLKGSAIEPTEIRVLDSEASDHLPILAEFRFTR